MTTEQAATIIELLEGIRFTVSLGAGLLVALILALGLSKAFP